MPLFSNMSNSMMASLTAGVMAVTVVAGSVGSAVHTANDTARTIMSLASVCSQTADASDTTTKAKDTTTGTDGKDGTAKPNGNAYPTLKDTPNALKLAQEFAKAGWSKASTAGVMGNIQQEDSTWDPQLVEESGGGGYGLAQWTPRSKIQAWMDTHDQWKGHKDSDLDVQVAMLLDIADDGAGGGDGFLDTKPDIARANGYDPDLSKGDGLALWRMWADAKDAKQAAVAWAAGYERPGSPVMNVRIEAAQHFYDEMDAAGVRFDTPDGQRPKDAGKDDDGKGPSPDTATRDATATVADMCCAGGTDDTDGKDSATVVQAASTQPGNAPADKKAFVARFGQIAFDVGKKFGIPYEAILTTAAYESGTGASVPGHNYFGIKKWKEGQKTVTTGTTEEVNGAHVATTADWVAYDSDEAGWTGYGEYITQVGLYGEALKEENAHDPVKYQQKVSGIYATESKYMEQWMTVYREVQAAIDEAHKWPPSSQVTYDAKPPASDSASKDSASSGSDSQPRVCATAAKSSGGKAEYGQVGGAPTDTHDYGWMCDWGGICKDGDGLGHRSTDKNFYAYDVGRYQCVWYAWNRLAMIHGSDGWNWYQANGGEFLTAPKPDGWIVDENPHPGDGVNLTGHVAVVEKVEKQGDGWRIFISEGNFNDGSAGLWTAYNTRWLNQGSDPAMGFFRWKGWKN